MELNAQQVWNVLLVWAGNQDLGHTLTDTQGGQAQVDKSW